MRADGSGKLDPGYSHYFVIPSDGGVERQITSGNFHHRGAPSWTPDNKNLIFSANRNEDWEYQRRNSEIYSVSITDGIIKKLTDRNGPDGGATVSPDSRRIAYLGFDDKVQTYQVTNIYIMNADGSGKKEIKTKLDRSPSRLTWSSTGDGLYFQYDIMVIQKLHLQI